ncbi:class I SAM-dependent DNA methyltransferase [Streptomyces sp. MMG1533]|uniref:class I SAM-dependent DNA methyltransferase n=1 Tax=Streptomyces sp. MMG1533 TaxID=1415546 RepID=UPI00131C6DF3|nr:class I SAM-dependent methyltransferase [Streptomyces sp. MMG1533]
MEEWVDETVRRILTHRPRRVLEIGCGTGLLGNRIIPELDAYCGMDFSVGALQRFALGLDSGTKAAVSLVLGSARDLDLVPTWEYDCVVLNSVLQYFPDTAYVSDVLLKASRLLQPNGVLFLGDVRHQSLVTTHHLWRAWLSSPDDMAARTARDEAARRAQSDREWCAAPADLEELLRSVTGARHMETHLKDGRHPTEMNLFRYDVVGYFGTGRPLIQPTVWFDWSPGLLSRFSWAGAEPVGIRGVPNSRIASMVDAAANLESASPVERMGKLRAGRGDAEPGDALSALRRLAEEHQGALVTNWAADRSGETLDLALVPPSAAADPGPVLVQWGRPEQ